MLLLSETYRQSSTGNAESQLRDPNNDYFARFNVRRLSAEELRDSVLTVNQRINWQQSGPSIFPDVSDDVKAGQSVPGKGWGKSSDADKSRRSVYIHIKRSLIPPELSVFDFPETDTSCEARFLTTQAAKAATDCLTHCDCQTSCETRSSPPIRVQRNRPTSNGLCNGSLVFSQSLA